VLLPIYPARELPIEGITEQIIAERVSVSWSIVEREALPEALAAMDTDVVVTFGAGNIDAYCGAVADVIAKKS
jgi:UDP-N-acetylmuramate--alanine ligase